MPGLINRLVQDEIPKHLYELDDHPNSLKLKGVSAFGMSANWETSGDYTFVPGLRTLLETLWHLVARRSDAGNTVCRPVSALLARTVLSRHIRSSLMPWHVMQRPTAVRGR